MASSLLIYMNGYEVGEYIRRSGGVHELVYHDSWLGLRGALPLSLSLPITDKSHKGDVVYNYFDNLLPDSMDIRNRIQAKFGAKTNQPFDLLSCIGNDCVGAIQLTSGRTGLDVKKIEGIPLNESEIAEELRNYKGAAIRHVKRQGIQDIHCRCPGKNSIAHARRTMATSCRHNAYNTHPEITDRTN